MKNFWLGFFIGAVVGVAGIYVALAFNFGGPFMVCHEVNGEEFCYED